MSIGNEALVAMIRDRLGHDSRIASQAVDVCCADGYVLLVGCVDTIEQRDIAVQLVTGLIGVRNVVNELAVRCARPIAGRAGGVEVAAAKTLTSQVVRSEG